MQGHVKENVGFKEGKKKSTEMKVLRGRDDVESTTGQFQKHDVLVTMEETP